MSVQSVMIGKRLGERPRPCIAKIIPIKETLFGDVVGEHNIYIHVWCGIFEDGSLSMASVRIVRLDDQWDHAHGVNIVQFLDVLDNALIDHVQRVVKTIERRKK